MSIALYKYFWAIRTAIRRFSFGHIGKMTYMGPVNTLFGTKKIYLGNKVRIQPGCRLEAHDEGEIHIMDDVSIGQNFHCTAGGKLIIGSHTTISGNTFVTDIDHEYQEIGKHILEQPMRVTNTEIGENCFIGYGVAIQAGTKLGKQCIVGANAVVRGEYPDYCVLVGVPARVVKRYNTETKQWEKISDANR